MTYKVHFWIAVLAGAVWLAAGQGSGQEPIQRLPAIDATRLANPAGQPPLRVGSRPGNDPLPPTGTKLDLFTPPWLPEILRRFPSEQPPGPYRLPAPELPDPRLAAPPKLSSHKQGFFQKLSISATWLDGGRVNDMGITELVSSLTVALPLPTKDHPLLITPVFEARFLHGPHTPDLPGTVYSAYTQFIWAPKLAERWRAILGIEPGAYGDFEKSDAETFRLLGRGMVHFDWIPDRLEVLAGVLYLDRSDVRVLPAGGIIWSPTDDVRYEIVFPKPKLARRISWDGHAEHWIYLAGEFGGDTWAVLRANGAHDVLTLSDIRVMVGFERKLDGGAGAAIEIGYVFDRDIEYDSQVRNIDLPDTFMIRGVLRY